MAKILKQSLEQFEATPKNPLSSIAYLIIYLQRNSQRRMLANLGTGWPPNHCDHQSIRGTMRWYNTTELNQVI